MKKLVYILLPILFVSTSISCKDDKKVSETEEHAEGDGHDHGSEEGHEHGEEESETEVTLTEAQVKAIKIEFGNIEMKELNDAIKANGFLKVPNQNKAQVTSLYSFFLVTVKVIF